MGAREHADPPVGVCPVRPSAAAPYAAPSSTPRVRLVVADQASRAGTGGVQPPPTGPLPSRARLQQLTQAGLVLGAAKSMGSLLTALTEQARRLVGAHQAVTSLTAGDGWEQVIWHVTLSEKYADWRDWDAPPTGEGIYAVVCRDNQPMRLTQAELEAHPAWRGFGAHAGAHPPLRGWLAVPLIGRLADNLGLIQLSDREDGGDFDADDESVVVQLAQIASVALDNLRLYDAERAARAQAEAGYRTQRDVAVALQRSLLPRRLPTVPGLQLAARYLPGGRRCEPGGGCACSMPQGQSQAPPDGDGGCRGATGGNGVTVGGDWYDAIALPGGRVGLAVGDVMGHGVHAASVMAQLRATMRGAALAGAHPAAVLRHVDRVVQALDEPQLTTCLYGVYEPATRTLKLAVAGHPPPLLVSPGVAPVLLALDPGLPLGVSDATFISRAVELPPGATLLLYSDGLIEDPARSLDDGLERLLAAFALPPAGAEDACDRALALLGHAGRDDVALLAAVTPTA